MSYHFSKRCDLSFDEAIDKVTQNLKEEGFGILTQIDVTDTLKKKINVDFRKYRILGACNPGLAHQALQTEAHIGTMLPCNVIVQQYDDGAVEVSAIDPVASMAAVDNPRLQEIAGQVRDKMKAVIERL